jgi:hypothetical protein
VKSKIKKIGLIIAAGACAFIIYMFFLVAITLMHNYFDSREMLEPKLFSGSFLKPIGFILIAVWLILSGIFLSYKKARNFGMYILILYVFVSIVPYGLSFFNAPSNSASDSTNEGNENTKIVVSDTVQLAGGITENDMNREFLSNYSDFLMEALIIGLKQHLESQNKYLPDDFDIPLESMYINSGGKKLAVIRFTISGGASGVEILGIKGDKLHRVSCNHQSPEKIPLLQGKCANRISEIFKVALVKGMKVEHL